MMENLKIKNIYMLEFQLHNHSAPAMPTTEEEWLVQSLLRKKGGTRKLQLSVTNIFEARWKIHVTVRDVIGLLLCKCKENKLHFDFVIVLLSSDFRPAYHKLLKDVVKRTQSVHF